MDVLYCLKLTQLVDWVLSRLCYGLIALLIAALTYLMTLYR